MITKAVHRVTPSPKKAYQTPKLKVMGNVEVLTLKIGSITDGMGGTFS